MKRPLIHFFILFTLLTIVSSNSKAQSSAEFKKLIARTWKVNFYQLNGEKLNVSQEQQEAKVIYNENNTMTMTQVTYIRRGVWKYDEAKKELTVTYTEPTTTDLFQLKKISETEMILEIDDPNRGKITFNFLPVNSK
jgi:hypothetical protein